MSRKQIIARSLGVLLGVLGTAPAHAQCWGNTGGGDQIHYSIINGLDARPTPAITFDLPGDRPGDGNSYASTLVLNGGGTRTLANHVRFRVYVSDRTSRSVAWQTDSATPLSCTNCASSVTMPFSALGWTANRALESVGTPPANGRFNDVQQTWLVAPPNTETVVNLQFDFLNDKVYPAGVYQGEFQTIGRPQ